MILIFWIDHAININGHDKMKSAYRNDPRVWFIVQPHWNPCCIQRMGYNRTPLSTKHGVDLLCFLTMPKSGRRPHVQLFILQLLVWLEVRKKPWLAIPSSRWYDHLATMMINIEYKPTIQWKLNWFCLGKLSLLMIWPEYSFVSHVCDLVILGEKNH